MFSAVRPRICLARAGSGSVRQEATADLTAEPPSGAVILGRHGVNSVI